MSIDRTALIAAERERLRERKWLRARREADAAQRMRMGADAYDAAVAVATAEAVVRDAYEAL